MVVVAECSRGLGHPQMERWLDGRSAAELGRALRHGYQVYGQTAHALRTKAEAVAIWLVSSLPPETVRRAGLRPARKVDHALREARQHVGSGTAGYLLPRGAAFLPVQTRHG
jgi:nickel-dependent lactate racemase